MSHTGPTKSLGIPRNVAIETRTRSAPKENAAPPMVSAAQVQSFARNAKKDLGNVKIDQSQTSLVFFLVSVVDLNTIMLFVLGLFAAPTPDGAVKALTIAVSLGTVSSILENVMTRKCRKATMS